MSGTLNLKSAMHRVLEILVAPSRRRARHRDAAARGRRAARRGVGRPRQTARAGDAIAGRRGHHGPGRRRAASRSSCRASAASRCCCTARRGAPELPEAGAELRLRADLAATARRLARWRRSPFKPDRDFDSSVKFLGVVASMIAQALKIQRLVEEERRRLVDENTHLRQELRERYDFSNIIGTSGPMRQMYEQVAQVARTNTTVLIRGESGTGKELIAHAIHYNSLRAKKPFVKVSCAALPDTLIESELFGHEKGAFTGRRSAQEGALRAGRGRHAVPRRDRRHQPEHAGQAAARAAGARVRAARRHRDDQGQRPAASRRRTRTWRRRSPTGRSARTCYYRLNVFTIFVPPLRERKADLLLLADHFLEKFSREHGKIIKRISTPAIDMLMTLSLARQRPRARERPRARGPRLRRRR